MKRIIIITTILFSFILALTMCKPAGDSGDGGDGGDTAEYWVKVFEEEDSIKFSHNVIVTSDGYYLMLGTTTNFFTDAIPHYQVYKVDPSGDIVWQKKYEAPGDEGGDKSVILETSDGKYMIVGLTNSFGSGGFDGWLVKLDTDGSILWQKAYGGVGADSFYGVQETSDDGFILSGFTSSFGVDKNLWIVKMDSSGGIEWEKTLGDDELHNGYTALETSDGDFIITADYNNENEPTIPTTIVKMDSDGNVLWQKLYSATTGSNIIYSSLETGDGNIMLLGATTSFGSGDNDFLIVKIDTDGNVLWEYAYGGSGYDNGRILIPAFDGNYLAVGQTDSFGEGGRDFWMVKIDPDGNIITQKAFGGSDFDSSYGASEINQNGDLIMIGRVVSWITASSGLGAMCMPADGFDTSLEFTNETTAVKIATSITVTNSSFAIADTSATITDTTASAVDTDDAVVDVYP